MENMMQKIIMLVEDNERLRKNLLFMLKRQGFEAIGAENGKVALALVHEKRPDLIVSDIMMPDMNGYELLEALRAFETTLSIPVIFLTSKGTMNDIRTGMLLGADDYLTKPVDFQELVRVITTRLTQHERQRLNLAAQTESVQRHLMSVLPHELRTPLSGIIGASTLIRSEIATLTKEDIFELNECILSSSRRLARITENFLLYATIRPLLDNPVFTPIVPDVSLENAEHLVREVVLTVADGCARMNDVELSLQDATLSAKQRHVERAISEVALNAFTFSAIGSLVRVSSRVVNNVLMIDITNEGRGMTEEQISHLKQPISSFIQYDRDEFEQQGTGLGLALTRSIIALYGGFFNIASNSEQTTVSLGFPLHKP
ncbi:MAG: hybrid sensor histidine kinase/response regulator [Candidatus Kapaibacterium sp.]|nr:MAG: hybrid sensor histidine kinase/response regulator [Candidatus Kapabacteria bacterium]